MKKSEIREMIRRELLKEVSSNVGSYHADEGEPDTGWLPGGHTRRVGTRFGKPEPWFNNGNYTQIDFPKADYIFGKDVAPEFSVVKMAPTKNVDYDKTNDISSGPLDDQIKEQEVNKYNFIKLISEVNKMELKQFYKQTFDNGDEVYFYPIALFKNGNFKGYKFDVYYGKRLSGKPKQKSFPKSFIGLWKKVDKLDPKIRQRFSSVIKEELSEKNLKIINEIDISLWGQERSTDEFMRFFKEFMNFLTKKIKDYYKKNYENIKWKDFEIKRGRRWYKIILDNSVYCFVEARSGDIYKAAGWAKPAKGVRASIFDKDSFKDADPFGGWLYRR